ncbi:hypothetical protein WKI71_44430 [Streptomyces sp. MS1.AVA.1]|uniref:Uncharacterized protein n=1 Tax=Streptomyces machairae TaxID=3134109 RepID=A0ABU8UWX9_9ACTN
MGIPTGSTPGSTPGLGQDLGLDLGGLGFTVPGAPLPDPTGAPTLGHSLAVDDGDLVIDGGTGNPATVEGLDALTQALTLTVETQLGSDRLHTTFGFDRLAVGRYPMSRLARKEYIRLELVRCLAADRRITDIREVFFQDDPRFFELRPRDDGFTGSHPASDVPSSRTYTAYVIIETVAGDTLTLRSGGRLE